MNEPLKDQPTVYTIQEIRDMLGEYASEMNPYQYLDAAKGILVVQEFLGGLETVEKFERENRGEK